MALLRPQKVQPRLAEIGRIFKGGPKQKRVKDGKEYEIQGQDLDHFRFEPSERLSELLAPDGSGSLASYLTERWNELGDAPRAITIRFLGSTVADVFKAEANEVWATIGGASRCVRRCNGETQLLHLTKDKKLSKEPIPCDAVEGENECPNKCKPTGRLFFMVPALEYPGLIVLTTHSINDIIEIKGNLALYENWDLSKIPFRLCRTKRSVTRNENGTLRSMDKWLLHIEIDPSFGNAIFAQQPRQYLAQLSGADPAAIEGEFVEGEIPQLPSATIPVDWELVKELTGFKSEFIQKIAVALKLPSEFSSFTLDDEVKLRNMLFVEWAFHAYQGKFKAFQYAKNAFNKIYDASCSDREMFEIWATDCNLRSQQPEMVGGVTIE